MCTSAVAVAAYLPPRAKLAELRLYLLHAHYAMPALAAGCEPLLARHTAAAAAPAQAAP